MMPAADAVQEPSLVQWDSWWAYLDQIFVEIKKSKGVNLSSTAVRAKIKTAVSLYFGSVRPILVELGLGDEGFCDELDWIMQDLLSRSVNVNRRSTYGTRFRELNGLRAMATVAVQTKQAGRSKPASQVRRSEIEQAILDTLGRMLPSARASYLQVVDDLSVLDRASYRGTAAEIREVLRETLDHLAPDDDVKMTIKFDEKQARPSMKQKTTFILKARGLGDTKRKPAEDGVSLIEGMVGALTRSIYDRGSVSTHVAATYAEVKGLKAYADAVLCELLQVY
jgi:hypothetical protein